MRYMGLASLVVLVMLLIRLPKEEQKLIARFGDECRAYVEAHRAACWCASSEIRPGPRFPAEPVREG
jgi:hypothetical protein